ncbi:hypothetical protein LCGC14_1371230 [marine sediment metagenome]|uniref:Uncharacterized protein n=1 Tax=marine sediment metagenome TaxID=412755 RepID=A0A0F9MKL2_9ZZZZ
MTISTSAKIKIKEHQACLEVKKRFNACDFFIYKVKYRHGVAISLTNTWAKKFPERYEYVKNSTELESSLERMSGGLFAVIYLDTEEVFRDLTEFLEYYYIRKLAGI